LLGASFVGYLILQRQQEILQPNVTTSILGLKVSPMETIGEAEWEGSGLSAWSNTSVCRRYKSPDDYNCPDDYNFYENRLLSLSVTMMSARIQGFDSQFQGILPFASTWAEQEYELLVVSGNAWSDTCMNNDILEYWTVGFFVIPPRLRGLHIQEQSFVRQQQEQISLRLSRAELQEICSYLPTHLSEKLREKKI
jgi:hypothetical protein